MGKRCTTMIRSRRHHRLLPILCSTLALAVVVVFCDVAWCCDAASSDKLVENDSNVVDPLMIRGKKPHQQLRQLQSNDFMYEDSECFSQGIVACPVVADASSPNDTAMISSCSAHVAPVVCGSCGKYYYSNSCTASASGWNVETSCTEECPTSVFLSFNDSCDDDDDSDSPVYCGLNGWCKYSNACLAEKAGYNVKEDCKLDTYVCPSSANDDNDCPCFEEEKPKAAVAREDLQSGGAVNSDKGDGINNNEIQESKVAGDDGDGVDAAIDTANTMSAAYGSSMEDPFLLLLVGMTIGTMLLST